jgi:hypothetical protein
MRGIILIDGRAVDAATHFFGGPAERIAASRARIAELETAAACETGALRELALALLRDARAELADLLDSI